MQTCKKWRQAITLSVFVHFLFLMGIGWFSVFAHPSPVQQDYIELELFSSAVVQQATSQSSLSFSNIPPLETSVPEAIQNTVSTIAETANVTFAPINAPIAQNRSGSESAAGSQTENVVAGEIAGQTKPILLAPRILQKTDPAYPDQARREGWEGSVRVRFQVLTNGKTENISVETSSGFAMLDESAMNAIQQWQFIPAKNQNTNQPVACWTYVTLVFKLNNTHSK